MMLSKCASQQKVEQYKQEKDESNFTRIAQIYHENSISYQFDEKPLRTSYQGHEEDWDGSRHLCLLLGELLSPYIHSHLKHSTIKHHFFVSCFCSQFWLTLWVISQKTEFYLISSWPISAEIHKRCQKPIWTRTIVGKLY